MHRSEESSQSSSFNYYRLDHPAPLTTTMMATPSNPPTPAADDSLGPIIVCPFKPFELTNLPHPPKEIKELWTINGQTTRPVATSSTPAPEMNRTTMQLVRQYLSELNDYQPVPCESCQQRAWKQEESRIAAEKLEEETQGNEGEGERKRGPSSQRPLNPFHWRLKLILLTPTQQLRVLQYLSQIVTQPLIIDDPDVSSLIRQLLRRYFWQCDWHSDEKFRAKSCSWLPDPFLTSRIDAVTYVPMPVSHGRYRMSDYHQSIFDVLKRLNGQIPNLDLCAPKTQQRFFKDQQLATIDDQYQRTKAALLEMNEVGPATSLTQRPQQWIKFIDAPIEEVSQPSTHGAAVARDDTTRLEGQDRAKRQKLDSTKSAAPSFTADDDDLMILSQPPQPMITAAASHGPTLPRSSLHATAASAAKIKSKAVHHLRHSSTQQPQDDRLNQSIAFPEGEDAFPQFPIFDEFDLMEDDDCDMVDKQKETIEESITYSQMAQAIQDIHVQPEESKIEMDETKKIEIASSTATNAISTVEPMDIDSTGDTKPNLPSTSPVPQPSASPVQPDMTSTSPTSSSTSVFLQQLLSMRTILVTKLSVGLAYQTIESVVSDLLKAATNKEVTSSQILTKLKSHAKLTAISRPLGQFFQFAQLWRVVDYHDFDAGVEQFQFDQLSLAALFVFFIAYLDSSVSISHVRTICAAALGPRMKQVDDSMLSQSFPRLLTFIARSHTDSLLQSVLLPWLNDVNLWSNDSKETPSMKLLLGLLPGTKNMIPLSTSAILCLLYHVCQLHVKRLESIHSASSSGLPISEFGFKFLNHLIVQQRLELPLPPPSQMTQLLQVVNGRGSRLVLPTSSLTSTSSSSQGGDGTISFLCLLLVGCENSTLVCDDRLLKLVNNYVDIHAHLFHHQKELVQILLFMVEKMGESATVLKERLKSAI